MTLTKSELDNLALEKAAERFKKANKDWNNAIKLYEPLFALALAESVQQEKDKDIDENGSFFTGCNCKVNDSNFQSSLNYKQTTAPCSSLR